MKKFLLVFIANFLLTTTAVAADRCYSPAELEAENTLRLHSELMVITVTCRQGSEGENLVPAYTGFTKDNIGVLHEAEQTMIRYYKKNYGGDGIPYLDSLRTRLANEFGQKAANVSAPVFCSLYRNKVLNFYDADPTQLHDEVKHMCVAEKSYGHLCGDGTRIAKHGQ